MEEQAKQTFLINTAYYAVLAAGIALLLRFFFLYFVPFLAGAIIAFFVQKPARFLHKKWKISRRILAVTLAALIFLFVAALAFGLIFALASLAGRLLGQLSDGAPDLSAKFDDFKNAVRGFLGHFPEGVVTASDKVYDRALERIPAALTSALSSLATGILKNMPLFLFGSLAALISACYMAADFPGLATFLKSMTGSRFYGNLLTVKDILTTGVLQFLKGYALLFLINTVLLGVGFLVLNIKYAPFLAVAIAFADVLPVIGTGTILIPWGIVRLLASDWYQGVGLLLIFVVIAVVRNLTEPKIIGKQIGVAPLFTLMAMFVGFRLLGVAGLILLPLALLVVIEYYKRQMKEELSEAVVR